MSLFTVDEEKCKKDGICAAECPIGVIINFDDKEKVVGYPKYKYYRMPTRNEPIITWIE